MSGLQDHVTHDIGLHSPARLEREHESEEAEDLSLKNSEQHRLYSSVDYNYDSFGVLDLSITKQQ